MPPEEHRRHDRGNAGNNAKWCGQSIERVEDAALLTGRGRYIDDIGVRTDTLHAAILRSPHAHAVVKKIDVSAALHAPGVVAVLTGAEVVKLSAPLAMGIRAPIQCWPIAVERVRYVGEPVAVVVAADRYLAEDALELIEVDYEPLEAVVDPVGALTSSVLLHDGLKSNIASERKFRYGDPESAFAKAAHRIAVEIKYPRNSCTPIETYGVVAEYDPGEDSYDVLANFMGPFTLHAVMARALKVPGNRFRLRTPPDSGGSFGVKQGVFPYVVLMSLAARLAGRPVKWIEDRLEHLAASVSATNRVTKLEAAVEADGRVTALSYDQVEDVGAHIRAPEPATLYRMQGNLTGAYAIRNVAVKNRVVLTNKTPTGLNRGFGGPQVYYALERLMQRIAIELKLDPLDVIRRNLVPAGSFPYRTASGGLLDSGDYPAAVEKAVQDGGLAELKARQAKARAEGKLYGIGLTAAVEPSVSNMGYITAVLTPEERRKAGPKNGAQATATVAVDPSGAVSVHVASVPQGQGHRTVLAQVVADALGLAPNDIRVVGEMDTARDAWSIASGNYSSRFAAAVCGAAHLAAMQIEGEAEAQRSGAAQRAGGRDRVREWQDRRQGQSRQRGAVRPSCRGEPLVAGRGAGRRAGAARDRVLDAAAIDRAGRERRDQLVALPRLHLRFLRRRGRPRHRRGADRQIRHHARLRHRAASRHGGGADHRRLRARAWRRHLRGVRLFGGRRVPVRHVRRLSGADHDRGAGARHPARRDAVAVHAARRQGRRRRQLHVDAGLPRQCGGRCVGRRADRSAADAKRLLPLLAERKS